ncbi:uncharacterized protein LOC121185485 [Toxotes jaculatrix]|uniref:uncharacterized protein LOC121185485 n=1 Tax=Toxotes jaculatrix TaxID=941984 RepID=UPI001B3AB789|nr:uncharacterized protein LOC121185485 [Toxotes jaculatrix]
MASVTLLLQLLLMAPAASAWSMYPYYRYYGGSVTFSPKGRNSDGTYEVELRNKQTSYYCYTNGYTCSHGDCGSQTLSTGSYISSNSYGIYWCQYEVVTRRKLNSTLPFEIRYPTTYNTQYGQGYWISNVRSSLVAWSMTAHVDLGTRSDTGQSNRSPITTIPAILRVPRNCPRSFNIMMFDPDGDRVRCRVPTNSSTSECGLCSLTSGFSLDELNNHHSCSKNHHSCNHPSCSNNHSICSKNHPSYSNNHPICSKNHPSCSKNHSICSKNHHNCSNHHSSCSKNHHNCSNHHPSCSNHHPSCSNHHPSCSKNHHNCSNHHPSCSKNHHNCSNNHHISTTTTAAPTTTTAAPTTTTAATTAAPTTTTSAPTTTTTAAPRTTTAATTTAETTTTTAETTADPYRTSPAPLSQLPLQFSVKVEWHYAPSCLDGDYFPIFLAPTPINGITLTAFVNQTLEIKVKSTAQYSTVYNLFISGPKDISLQRISAEEYIIKWTPTENELNDRFPICFVSEARTGYYMFQSEIRCVIVEVGMHEAAVTCNETTITVEVEKSDLIRRNEDSLHLNEFIDPSCNLTRLSNTTHLVAVMSLNTCGTTVEEDEDNIIFKNKITSADPNQIISRQDTIDIIFSCSYPKRTNLTLGFRHKNPYAFTEKGFGSFTFQFEFFESQLFRKQIDAGSYPVDVYLKQMMFMQIEATTSIPNTELFVESCKATPYDNPDSRVSYTIIKNGCVKDKTVQIYPSSKSQFRFGMEAFEFIGAHEEVYITCLVVLCEAGVSGTRCSQGCIRSDAEIHRGKREAAGQSSRHSISQGPLRLVKTSDSQASVPGLNLGMNLVFIIGCLLVCGVVIYRSRRPKAKYQRLPTSDTD